MNTSKKRIALVTGLVLTVLALFLVFWGLPWAIQVDYDHTIAQERRDLINRARVGMTRGEVIRRLGRPWNVARSPAEFDRREPFPLVPTRAVEKKVLEYYSGAWKLYVYIDRRDRVTALYVAPGT